MSKKEPLSTYRELGSQPSLGHYPQSTASSARNSIKEISHKGGLIPQDLKSSPFSDSSSLAPSSQTHIKSTSQSTTQSYLYHSDGYTSERELFPAELPQPTPKRGFFGRMKDSIYSQIDPKAVFHLLDFRPWFYPFTWKKYIVLFILAGIIAGIVISDYYFHWIQKSIAITRSYMLPVLVISVCAEPIIVFIILPVAIMPDIPKNEVDLNMRVQSSDIEKGSEKFQPQGPFETALVIPCHDTDHVAMKTTLDSAFPHFRPQDIYIVDNGRTRYPSHPEGNFREYIRSLHPDIEYMWSPIGSKNAAQLVGALAARNKGYKYIMTVDDDVCIPPNYSAPTEMIDDKFKAVAYPIKAMDAKCEVPLWLVAWQDVEYRLSGLSKLAEDRLCGVQFPHGAGWFVELDAFVELMEFHHPMDFIAEDCNAGLGLSKMGKGIRFDARSFLATEVPTTFFGPGLNWWKQRQKSWEMGRHGRLFAFIRHFFFSMPPRKTIQGILWHKFTFFYLICTIIIDWLRIPTIIALGRTATWWRNACLLMLFSALPPMAYNYWKCRRRPDMQVRFWASFTYPLYKQLYVLVSIFGAIRWAGYFLGGHVAPPTIQQMLKRGDDRCFWLDPRFKDNPAWLADEAEEMAKGTPGQVSGIVDTEVMSIKEGPLSKAIAQPKATYSSPLINLSSTSLAIESSDVPLPYAARGRNSPSLSPFLDPASGPPSPSWMGPPSPRPSSRSDTKRPVSRNEGRQANPFRTPPTPPLPMQGQNPFFENTSNSGTVPFVCLDPREKRWGVDGEVLGVNAPRPTLARGDSSFSGAQGQGQGPYLPAARYEQKAGVL